MVRAGNVRVRVGAAVIAVLTAGSLALPATAAQASQSGGQPAAAARGAAGALAGKPLTSRSVSQNRTGSLAGTVRAPASAGQPGGAAVCVRATLQPGSDAIGAQLKAAPGGEPLAVGTDRERATASAIAGSDGQYQMTGLAPGIYRLTYQLCSLGGQPMVAGTLSAPRQSRLALVTAGRTQVLPSAPLQQSEASIIEQHTPAWLRSHASPDPAAGLAARRKGHITGTVTAPSGRPLRGICVFILGKKRLFQSHSGPAGGYLKALPPGRYQVAFETGCGNHGNWLLQFYKNTPDQSKDRTVIVKAGKTTRHISAVMHAGGEIRGTVTNTAGKPLSGICVEIFNQKQGFGFGIGTRRGHYDIHAVEPGDYDVEFAADECGNKGNFAPQQWKDKAPGQQPTTLHVTPGRVFSRISAVMSPGAEVSGKVTLSTTGAPLPGVCVEVFGQGALGETGFFTSTKADGTYLAKDLSTGKYRVGFQPGCPNDSDFLGATLPGSVQLTDGTNTSGVDIALTPGGKITGLVTSRSGKPLAGICVFAEGGRGFGQVHTNASGHYTVGRLSTGKYEVDFSTGCGSEGSFAPQSFDNEANPAGADLVSVTAAQTSSGINAIMQPGATIAGRVTDSAGHPASGACVVAVPNDVSREDAFTRLDHGRYRLGSLPPGQFSIFFVDCGATGLAPQGYGAPPGMSDGPLVQLPAGRVTAHLDGVMIASGNISGTVRATAGRALSNICATAFGRHTGAIAQAITNGRGRYKITEMPPDSYRVQFFNCLLGNVAPSWYRNKPGPRSATPVLVRARSTTAGIDARLAKGGSVSGVVTDQATGKPVSNVCVDLFSTDISQLGFDDVSASTGSKGRYSVGNLATGSYFAEFFPCGSQLNLTSEFRRVHITAGRHTSGLNETLRPGGSVSGIVLGGSPATGQPDICVDVDPVRANVFGGFALSTHGGAFAAVGLAPGQYRVHFGDVGCAGDLVPQWYLHQASFATATTITVKAGATTKLQPDTLATDGQISGAVTGPGGAALSGVCVTATPVPARAAQQPVRAESHGGSYAIPSLLPGRYRVKFSSGCGATGLATQWWKNASSAAKATLVRVRASTATTGISAALRHTG